MIRFSTSNGANSLPDGPFHVVAVEVNVPVGEYHLNASGMTAASSGVMASWEV